MPRKHPLFYHVLKRKDGIVQRYRSKHYRLGKEYKQLPRTRALERRFGKRVRVYEKVKPKIVKPEVWRLTVAINNIPIGGVHKYYCYKIQRWGTKEDLQAMEKEEKDNCLKGLEELERKRPVWRSYKEDEWWWPEPDEGWVNVAYDEAEKLHERKEGLERHR